jgi:hypothetical protein
MRLSLEGKKIPAHMTLAIDRRQYLALGLEFCHTHILTIELLIGVKCRTLSYYVVLCRTMSYYVVLCRTLTKLDI